MRIRRKAAQPSRSNPLYILGHRGSFPTPDELRFWFDVEYGGPLRIQDRSGSQAHVVMATHGPWTAAVGPLLAHEADAWQSLLSWEHPTLAQVMPIAGQISDRMDHILHASRLARGLTLLTQGTAYDVGTQQYLNPSDWQDHPLVSFAVQDHVLVSHTDAPDGTLEWIFTRGLSKFGLEELETFCARGLPTGPLMVTLMAVAGALIGRAHPLTVGSQLHLPELDLHVQVLRHRTASPEGRPLTLREIAWSP